MAFLGASRPSCCGLVPVSGGIFKLLFASGHTPRTPNGWAAFSASKPCCFFKLVAPASHRRNRARLPHKKSSSWSWRTREERYPHNAEDNGSSCPSAPTTGGPCLPECNAAMVRLVSLMFISAYFYIFSHSSLSIIREGK